MHIISTTQTSKLSDKRIVDLLKKINEELGAGSGSVMIGQSSFNVLDNQTDFIPTEAQIISRADYTDPTGRLQVCVRRGKEQSPNNMNIRQNSAFFDEIYLMADQYIQTEMLQHVYKIVSSAAILPLSQESESAAENSIGFMQNELSKQANLYNKITEGMSERRNELEADYDRKLEELHEERKAQLADIETFRKKEFSDIAEARAEVEKLNSELHNQTYMHEMRVLREKISDKVVLASEKLIPRSAAQYRSGVLMLSLIGFSVFAAVAFYEIREYTNLISLPLEYPQGIANEKNLSLLTSFIKLRPTDAFLYALLIRGMLASFAALGFLVYAMRWLRQLHGDDVKAHRNYEMYALDINRASWAIETIMQMYSTQSSHAPETWIKGVCNQLFEKEGDKQKDKLDKNLLETLLDSSARAKIGTNGTEFEFDKKSSSKLANELSNAD